MQQPHSDLESLAIGDGSRLQIQSTGAGTLPLHNSSLKLDNILLVPKISHNLLSVFQLA